MRTCLVSFNDVEQKVFEVIDKEAGICAGGSKKYENFLLFIN